MKAMNSTVSSSRVSGSVFQQKFGAASTLFISANIANAGNLAFNMIFARLMGPEGFADLTFLLTLKLGVLCILSAFQLAFAKHTAKYVYAYIRRLTNKQNNIKHEKLP